LQDLHGKVHRLAFPSSQMTILNFWSAECPWSARTDPELLALLTGRENRLRLWTVAANANEPIEMLAGAAAQRGLPLVLHDAQQRIADLFQAETTPHVFLIDTAGVLRYRGALDDVTFRRRMPTCFYLQDAIQSVLRGEEPHPTETPAYGCSIVRFAD
jgi:hypothetical protein